MGMGTGPFLLGNPYHPTLSRSLHQSYCICKVQPYITNARDTCQHTWFPFLQISYCPFAVLWPKTVQKQFNWAWPDSPPFGFPQTPKRAYISSAHALPCKDPISV